MKLKKVAAQVLPEGDNQLIFRKWEEGLTGKGEQKIVLTHSSLDGNVIIQDHICVQNVYGCVRLEAFLLVFGIEWPEEGINVEATLDNLIGFEFTAVTENKEFRDVPTTKVVEYRTNSAVADESIDDDQATNKQYNEPTTPSYSDAKKLVEEMKAARRSQQ